jgi:hypothetical protein
MWGCSNGPVNQAMEPECKAVLLEGMPVKSFID